MKKLILLLCSIACCIIALSGCNKEVESVSDGEEKLVVYCGAGLKNMMEEVSDRYTKETGVKVEFIFNGSGALTSQIALAKTGDIFIPGEQSYIEKLMKNEGDDVILEQKDLFENVPVILVSKDKKDEIKSIEDLTKPTSNIGLGEESIAIGKLFNMILDKKGIKEAVDKQTSVRFGTVNQVVNAVEMGEIDAGVTFYLNYVDSDKDKVNMVKIPQEDNITQKIAISVLKYTSNETLAKDYVDFILSQGKDVFERYKYVD